MFYIIEIQEADTGAGQIVAPIKSATTENEAMSKYHEVLMYAAVSSVYRHTCLVMDGQGTYYAKETYIHPTESGGVVNE